MSKNHKKIKNFAHVFKRCTFSIQDLKIHKKKFLDTKTFFYEFLSLELKIHKKKFLDTKNFFP